MRVRVRVSAAILVLLGYGGSEGGVPAQAQESGAIADSSGAMNLVVSVKGQLEVKRKGWSQFAPALFGTSLRRGDLLRLGGGSSEAKVVCSGLTVHDVSSGVGGVPCVAARPVLRYHDDSTISPRGYESVSFPMVISPRKTKLLNPRPTLRWSPVEGVTRYRVIVRGIDVVWSGDVGSTKLVYPDTAPSLDPRNSYKLIVIANGRQSDEESAPGLGFRVVEPREAKEIREEEKKIRELGLSDMATQFLVVHLYATHGLNAEAIEQLEGLSKGLDEPAAVRMLGDLYVAVGLCRQAEGRYLLALELSKKANDEEGEALAHKALGAIYESLGNRDHVVQHFKSAVELFNRLGAREAVTEIEAHLTREQ